jgi:hypothetical protein
VLPVLLLEQAAIAAAITTEAATAGARGRRDDERGPIRMTFMAA